MTDICLFSMTLILFLLTHLSGMKVCYSWRQWNFISIKADKNVSATDRRGGFWKQKYAFAVTEMWEMEVIFVYLQLYSFEALQNRMKI